MTKVKLWNLEDAGLARRGLLGADRIRTFEIEALGDTGASFLVLPEDVCRTLGLPQVGTKHVRYADGRTAEVPLVSMIGIEILGREMIGDAMVHPAGTTPLIGQIELERLDLVVDPASREVRPNPAHPDGQIIEIFAAA